MEKRILGRTGLEVGVIGMGTEYLLGPKDKVVSVIGKAIDNGVNYFDLIFNFPGYIDNLGAAFTGKRDKLVLAGHLGSAEENGQYRRTRDVGECENLFFKLLAGLKTDYVDIVFIHNMDEEEDLRDILQPGGLLELAQKLRDQGKARYIGLSGHTVETTMKAIETGNFDVIIHPVNLDWDGAFGRKNLFKECLKRNIGLVAMKPYAGGELLKDTTDKYMPAKCLAYSLSNLGVSTVVPGVSSIDQLDSALMYLQGSSVEKSFHGLVDKYQRNNMGNCLYCNHCLPCPGGIDIGRVLRYIDSKSFNLKERDEELEAQATSCAECGLCMERCPFGVDVVEKFRIQKSDR